MYIEPDKLKMILIGMNLITDEEFTAAEKKSKQAKQDVQDVLIANNYINEDQLLQLISEHLKIPFVKLKNLKITPNTLAILPENMARERMAIVFDKDKSNVKVAMQDPSDLDTINFIRKQTGLDVKPYLATDGDIRKAMMLYRRGLYKEFSKIIQENVSQLAGEEGVKAVEKVPVVKILDSVIEYAVAEDASDIHLEPHLEGVVVRYRVDGRLRDVITLPKIAHDPLIARVKYLTNLKIDEHRKAQDGRFKDEVEGQKISFRVSIIPTYHGEKVVMRLLPEEAQKYSLQELGIMGRNLEIVQKTMKSPHGMIMVTGPTGSGKTTTLYTILNMLNDEETNISTIEDPIEYSLDRINQIQVNPEVGISFVNGLRSILRQDPDIIMIGEVRDSETAEIAIHSALTGHLVLSTLHTNDAAGTLPRLIDMGIEPFLIASTVNIAIAQRLVRRLCPTCMESYSLDAKAITSLKRETDIDYTLKKLAERGVVSQKGLKSLRFYKGKGCDQCGGTGFRGRLGIYEILEVTTKIRELITTKSDADKIHQEALREGMITMLEDGIQKAFEGLTTIDEVLRVIR
ncbi:GspE/PulE family protein [Patescibacteria group bacterium]